MTKQVLNMLNTIVNMLNTIDLFINKCTFFRPPGIYKQDYLQELFRRYDEVDLTPAAPILPDWCHGKLSVTIA